MKNQVLSISQSFNSTLVQLKVNPIWVMTGEGESFNSTLVQLKVIQLQKVSGD